MGDWGEVGAAFRIAWMLIAILATYLASPDAAAQDWNFGFGGADMDVEAGTGGFFADGIGRNTGVSADDTDTWFEGYVEPGIDAAFDLGSAGTLSGRVSAVGAITRGDGDPGGYSTGDDADLALEHAYLRWCSRALDEEGSCEGTFELSGGRLDFHIGDGFLVWDGNLDQYGKAAIWLGPRSAFEAAGVASVQAEPVRAQAFYLRSDED